MAMYVTMIKTAMGPDISLIQGKTYRLADTVVHGKELLKDTGDGPAARVATEDEIRTSLSRPTPDPEDENKGKPAVKSSAKHKEEDDIDGFDDTKPKHTAKK